MIGEEEGVTLRVRGGMGEVGERELGKRRGRREGWREIIIF